MPMLWYMGYAAQDAETGGRYAVRKDESGRVSVCLPPEAGIVHVWYEGLPWFHFTDLISWFGLFFFLHAAVRIWRKNQQI